MKEKKYVVGIDLGTTSARTVVFDFEDVYKRQVQIFRELWSMALMFLRSPSAMNFPAKSKRLEKM